MAPAFLLFGLGIAIALEMLWRIEFHTSRKVTEIMAGHMRVEASHTVGGELDGFTLLDVDDEAQVLTVHPYDLESPVGAVGGMEQAVADKIEQFQDQNHLSSDCWVHAMFDSSSEVIIELPTVPGQWPIHIVFTPRDCEMEIKRPSTCPMLTLAIFTLILCLTLVLLKAYQDLQKTFSLIDDTLHEAHGDAVILAEQGHTINSTAHSFADNLGTLASHCGDSLLLSPFTSTFMNSTGAMVTEYIGVVGDMDAQLAEGPSTIAGMRQALQENRHFFAWGPLLPVALISLVCLGIVIEAFVVEMLDSSSVAFEIDFTLRVATWFFAVIIVIVASVGAGELFAANFLSLFCLNVDENVLHATKALDNGTGLFNISQHYIIGKGYNPLTQTLQGADKMIFDIQTEYDGMESMLSFLGKVAMCPLTSFVHVNKIASSALQLLTQLQPLVHNAHIYPYYEKVVRQGMCGTVIHALGWILVAQISIGLVLFPLCIYFAHQFLTDWAIWEWAKEHAGGQALKMLPDSDSPMQSSRSYASEVASEGTNWTDLSEVTDGGGNVRTLRICNLNPF